MTVRLIAFAGSLRAASFNRTLAHAAAGLARGHGAEVEEPRSLLQAADWLHDNEEYLLAARTYRRALEALPEMRETYPYRYNGACAAALAGLGRGKDAASLSKEERTSLRERARAALVAELGRWRGQRAGRGPPRHRRPPVRQT